MKNARAQYKNTFLLNYIVVFIVKFLFFVGILINCITYLLRRCLSIFRLHPHSVHSQLFTPINLQSSVYKVLFFDEAIIGK